MRAAITIAMLMAAVPAFADEAASALAECQAHQARVEELEMNYQPQVQPSRQLGIRADMLGQDDLTHERELMQRTCDYARGLRESAQLAKARPQPAMTQFRSDTPPPSAPPRPTMRRPQPSPEQSNVGGTKARRAPDEQTPPQQ